MHATIDFETRSVCDIKTSGSWNYSRHESTEAMILSYLLPNETEVRRWTMALPSHGIAESELPSDLFEHIAGGGLVESHNAFFERVIWQNVMVERHGWPAIDSAQWRCSAAKAAASGLPRSLEGACAALQLPVEKDMEGAKLMLKMCKPRRPKKAELEAGIVDTLWHDSPEDFQRLALYCDRDVLAEYALSLALPDLSPSELRIWQIDQEMNLKGVLIDLDMAEAAIFLAGEWRNRLNTELEALTGVESGTKRKDLKAWLEQEEGLAIADTTKATLDYWMSQPNVSARAKRVMKIMTDVNKTSTSKYAAMLNRADPIDGRARDTLMYHGAATGRWSGKGIQVQNLPSQNLIFQDQNAAIETIKERDVDMCSMLYGDVLALLSHATRGAIRASKGKELIMADYSAIEARVVLWLAGAKNALDVFRKGGDIYCDMATALYGYEVIKSKHYKERQMGKLAILGLGYGMGFSTFLLTCRKYGISFSEADAKRIMGRQEYENGCEWVKKHLCIEYEADDDDAQDYADAVKDRLKSHREDAASIVHELALMKHIVSVYREKYPEVKQLWADQESAAIDAVSTWRAKVSSEAGPRAKWANIPIDLKRSVTGDAVQSGKMSWHVEDNFLICTLPSGRPMRYYSPNLRIHKTAWGEPSPRLCYMSVNNLSRKFEITNTYGGKIVENGTQAVARDFMANSIVKAFDHPRYTPVMSVHDELVAEVDKGEGNIDEFVGLMCDLESWADGCPITAEAQISERYKK